MLISGNRDGDDDDDDDDDNHDNDDDDDGDDGDDDVGGCDDDEQTSRQVESSAWRRCHRCREFQMSKRRRSQFR